MNCVFKELGNLKDLQEDIYMSIGMWLSTIDW